jgi:uroporphyrinogen decarboxylase
MTGKERILQTLRFEEPDRPPHFEVMFELEREAFGLQFPDRHSWRDMSPVEKDRAVALCMTIYERIVERFVWDGLCVFWPWSDPDGVIAAKRTFGDDLLIGAPVGHSVWAIESVEDWVQFSADLFENPGAIHAEAESRCVRALDTIDRLIDAGADFIFLANDVAFNSGPFIRPEQFAEFVTPYLARQVARIRERGALAFVHSDGNLMPILEDLVSTQPHVLHSIDPMAGMDIAEVERLTCGRVALMGNVQCSLLQDGPPEAIRESARYCLKHASPGGGYIFSTSNTIFPGMPLANYEWMLEVFGEFTAGR